MANQTTTRNINVRVKGDGSKELRKISRGFGQIERNTRRTSKALTGFRNVFGAAIAGFGVRELARVSDSVQLLFDRIRAFEGEEGAAKAFENLAGAANFTRTSIDALAESYTRITLATQELGLNQEAIIGLTTALQQSFRIAGSTIAEASAATIQLTQGLASGQLRGQELRSVLEANAVIGRILADEFNTTRGQLIKFAETGRITSDRVIKALANNFEELNNRAANLGQTIEQTVTIQFNNFKVALLDLNQTLGISQGIARLAENLDVLAAAIVGVGTAFASTKLIAILSSTLPLAIESTLVALAAFRFNFLATVKAIFAGTAAVNPLVAALGLLAGAITFVALNWDTAGKQIALVVESIRGAFLNTFGDLTRSLQNFAEKLGATDIAKNLGFIATAFEKDLGESDQRIEELINKLADLQAQSDGYDPSQFGSALKSAASNLENTTDGANLLSRKIGELNKQWREGQISASRYAVEVSKIDLSEANRQFDEGRKRLEDLEKARRAVKIAEFNNKVETGRITLGEYNDQLRQLEFERLEEGFRRGTTSAIELKRASLGIKEEFDPQGSLLVGVSDYIQSAGTLSQNIAEAIGNTFNRLEDSLVEFVQTGKFQFREFTKAILDDLTRIIIRQTIVNQLAGGILGSIGGGADRAGGTTASSSFYLNNNVPGSAKGDAFNSSGKISAFANGGVVSSPTFFGFGNRQMGVMGEAGSEAILPLKRGAGGDLGVKATPSNVTVNVINNTGTDSEISQRESEDQFGNKTLDIIINKKVNDGFAGGQFDKTMREIYGLRRRGR
jgi:tape measure domain-containing protein